MFKKTFISCAMIGAVALALASSGGGDKNKKSEKPRKSEFTPIRTINGFTLKAGPSYSYTGSRIFSTERNRSYITYNAVVTYQKGNSVIILPHQARVSIGNSVYRSNLRLLDLKIRFARK